MGAVLAKYNKNLLDTPEKNNSPQGDSERNPPPKPVDSFGSSNKDPKNNKPKKYSYRACALFYTYTGPAAPARQSSKSEALRRIYMYKKVSNSKINLKSKSAKSTNASDPNKPPKLEDNNNNTTKFPVYPHTPVKVYSDASVFKSDMLKDFKKVSIIYM